MGIKNQGLYLCVSFLLALVGTPTQATDTSSITAPKTTATPAAVNDSPAIATPPGVSTPPSAATTPNAPTTPSAATTPNAPTTPSTPTMPSAPATPSAATTSSAPITPSAPTMPSAPATPTPPNTPTPPGTPSPEPNTATLEKAKEMAASPQLFLVSSPPGNAEAGKTKSQVCIACHGVDGNSTVSAWPKIAGQGDLYLVKELTEYRKGDKGARFDPVMFAIVQNLSDQDIADLAAYFAEQTMSPGSAKADLVALGEKIYRGGNLSTGVPACAACHGAKGEGNELARFPRLSGQHEDYTLDQLKKFKDNKRSDDPNNIMHDISKRMSEDEMKAVSSYVSGLH